MSGFNRLIKNSIANIINGFSNVILGIVIAPFLVSILSENDFSVWSLNLQFGLFLGLFGVCIQVTVGRFVSEYLATGRKDIIDTLFSSSMLLSIGFFVLFLLLIFAFMNNYSSFVQAGDTKKYESYIYSFLLISLSFLFSMLISSLNGYFIGVERNDIIAIVNLCSRILLGICVVLTAQFGVVVMSVCFFCVNLLSFVAIYILFRKKCLNGSS